MKPLFFAFVAGIFFFAAFGAFAQALPQTPATSDTIATMDSGFGVRHYWFIAGFGLGSSGYVGEGALTLTLGRKDNSAANIVVIRSAGTVTWISDNAGYGKEKISEISALYGFMAESGGHFRSFALGLGYASGKVAREESRFLIISPFSTIGVALEARAFWHIGALGVGIGAFGNLNLKLPAIGLTANLVLGDLP